jgi:hypothetical protein
MLNPIIPLTSKKLSETFFSLYDSFQKKQSLTLAGNFSIPLNPILGNNRPESQVIARQKTNIQCFVWIQFTPQKDILTLGNAQLFTFESENFESIELSLLLDNSEELIIYLKGYLWSILAETGIQINVFSESPRGYSLGFSGTFAGILAEAITTIKQGWDNNEDLLQLRSKEDEVSHIAYNIEQILKPHDTNAPISFQTIFAEGWPSIFSLKSSKTGTRQALEKLNGIQYNLEHNLDYGVIYSWIPMTQVGLNRTENGEKKELTSWCKSKFWIQIGKNAYKQAMLDVLAFENLEFLQKLDTPIAHPESNEINEILKTGNQLAKSFEKLDGSSHFLDHIWKILEKHEILKETDIAILPIYTTTRWGSYIWYGKKWIARKNLYLAALEARKRYPELNMISDSALYTPHYSPEIRIVSDLRWKESSILWDEKKYLLYWQNSTEYIDIHNSRELSHGKLIVDQITRKIYINGEGVNSKEILSQQLTIDLIEKYISGWKMEIHASELPSSSYTQNKNEMMSKIVHPLVRTVLKRLGKNMRINCYGSTLDFTIRFEEIDIDMRTLKKT